MTRFYVKQVYTDEFHLPHWQERYVLIKRMVQITTTSTFEKHYYHIIHGLKNTKSCYQPNGRVKMCGESSHSEFTKNIHWPI